MSKMLLLGIYIIVGSFILSYIIAPLSGMFDRQTAIVIYIISIGLLLSGLLLGGKYAYDNCIIKIKRRFKKHRR